MNWVYGAIIVLVLLVGIPALWFAFSNPKFVYGLFTQAASALFNALLPDILKALKPKDLTPEQLDRHKRGKDLNLKRPDEGGHR